MFRMFPIMLIDRWCELARYEPRQGQLKGSNYALPDLLPIQPGNDDRPSHSGNPDARCASCDRRKRNP